jgi:hypothetical protein
MDELARWELIHQSKKLIQLYYKPFLRIVKIPYSREFEAEEDVCINPRIELSLRYSHQ